MADKRKKEVIHFWNDTHKVTMIYEPIVEVEPPVIIPEIPTGIKVTVTTKLPNIPTNIQVSTVMSNKI